MDINKKFVGDPHEAGKVIIDSPHEAAADLWHPHEAAIELPKIDFHQIIE